MAVRRTDRPRFVPQNYASDPRDTPELAEICKRTNRSMSYWIRWAVHRLIENPPSEARKVKG